MHPLAAARIVQDEAGIEVVAHISCRDRNIIGLQADLLGAAALGVKNILRRDLFDPVISGLRKVDPNLSCFRLTASRDVLIDRIASDTEDRDAYGWRMAHVEVCMESSRDPALGTEICTDGRTPEEVAEQILKRLALPTG
jgi:hypothetical protein